MERTSIQKSNLSFGQKLRLKLASWWAGPGADLRLKLYLYLSSDVFVTEKDNEHIITTAFFEKEVNWEKNRRYFSTANVWKANSMKPSSLFPNRVCLREEETLKLLSVDEAREKVYSNIEENKQRRQQEAEHEQRQQQ